MRAVDLRVDRRVPIACVRVVRPEAGGTRVKRPASSQTPNRSRPYNRLTLDLIPGSRLGLYDITAPIGEDGMRISGCRRQGTCQEHAARKHNLGGGMTKTWAVL